MKKIYLFLVASEDTLEEERMEITNLIRSMNERYSTKNIRVRLFKTGEAMTINPDNLNDSEMVLLVCHKDISKEDLAYFDIALKHFQSSQEPKTPRIITYFKSEQDNRSENLIQFLTHLDQDLGHYYTEYEKTDSLKYHILLNLLSLEDSFVVEYKDENITIDGHSFGSMKNMSCMMNHSHLQELKEKLLTVTNDFYEAMDAYDDNPSTENDHEYARLGLLREQIKNEIESLQSNIFLAMKNIASSVGNGELSPRSKEAFRLLELGEYERADAILDFSEISSDINNQLENLRTIEDTKKQIITTIRKTIDELLQKIKTLHLRTDYNERFLEIEKCYEKAFQSEIEANIEPVSGLEYVYFLQEQNEYEKTEPILEQMLSYYIGIKDSSLGEIAALNLAGWTYRAMNNYEESKATYLRAIDIAENMLATISDDRMDYLCTLNTKLGELVSASYNELGILYSDYHRNKEADDCYKQSLDIREKLSELYPNVYNLRLASSYGNIGLLYEEKLEYDKAGEYYVLAIENIRNYLKEYGYEKESSLILYYRNLGNLYRTMNQYEEAENILLNALEISERITKINPDAHEVKIAETCNDLGALYFFLDDYEKAEAMYLRALEINEKLIKRSFDVFIHNYVYTLNNLAVFYDYLEVNDLAKELYEKTITIYEAIKVPESQRYQDTINKLYQRLDDLDIDNEYIGDDECEYTLEEIFSYNGSGRPWVGTSYGILQNDDGEILFLLPYSGPGSNVEPTNVKLFYDGRKHAVLRGDGLPIIVCDYIHQDIREAVADANEILFAFSTDGSLEEESLLCEFMVPVIYLPRLRISQKAELFINEHPLD